MGVLEVEEAYKYPSCYRSHCDYFSLLLLSHLAVFPSPYIFYAYPSTPSAGMV